MSKSRYDITTLMVEDIEKLTDPECRSLSVGDLVVLEDGGEHYLYSVAYKGYGVIELRGLLVDKVETVTYEYNEETKKWQYDRTDEKVIIDEEKLKNFPKVHDMEGLIGETTDVSEFVGIKVGDVVVDNLFVFVGIVNCNDEEYFEAYGIQDDLMTSNARFDKTNLEWHVQTLEIGTKLYRHGIILTDTSQNECYIVLISNQASPYTSLADIENLSSTLLGQGSFLNDGDYILLSMLNDTEFIIFNTQNDVVQLLTTSTYPMTFVSDTVTPL